MDCGYFFPSPDGRGLVWIPPKEKSKVIPWEDLIDDEKNDENKYSDL